MIDTSCEKKHTSWSKRVCLIKFHYFFTLICSINYIFLFSQWRNTILNTTDSIYVDTNTATSSFSVHDRANSLINSSPTSYEFPETVNHPRAASDSETQPRGFRASIFETVNIMTKGGEVTKILVTGEISIQYNFPTIRDHSRPIRIRINDFETLEKSAPNTSYLRPAPDCVGQYDI